MTFATCPRCGGILDSLGRGDCDYRRGWGGAILAAPLLLACAMWPQG